MFKKIIIFAAAFLPMLSGFSYAEELGGASIYAGINWSATTVEVSGTTRADEVVNVNGVGQQAIHGTVGFDHAYTPGDKGLLMVGLSYDPNGYTVSDGTINSAGGSATTLDAELDSILTLYVSPGVRVNPSTGLYAKFAYVSGDASVLVTGINTSSVNTNRTFAGLGYGFGIRTLMTDSVFVAAEVLRTNYDTEGFESLNYGNGTTTGSLLIGLQF